MQSFLQILAPIGTIFHYVFYEPVYNILMVLYQGIAHVFPAGAFALSIVVLTLALRACMIPLTRKQLRSSRAMQELQPKLKELQARYKNDPQGLMQAQQALYKEHGVNPVSGCLPLLIQMPFIYALYDSFFTALKPNAHETAVGHLARINADLYPFVPHLQHLPLTTFFWTNLAAPDPLHILPVLAALFTFIQLRMAMPVRKPAPAGARQDSMTQATSTMQYIMPFFTLFIAWTFPAGLSLYWVTSTIFSAAQQYFISGWGSLFVGVPASLLATLHLPEPKEASITAPMPPKAVTPSTARALTAPTSAPATNDTSGGGGLKGMFKQLREQMAAAQASALVAQEEKAKQAHAARNAPADGDSSAASAAQDAAVTASSSTSTGQREQRPRPRPKNSPMLVKPSQPKAELPEDAIRRDGSDSEPFVVEPLPEVTIAQVAGGDGSGTSKNGNGNGANTGSAAGAKRPAAAPAGVGSGSGGSNPSSRPATGGQRKGTNTNKGTQSARSRSGRPKGGR